MKPRLAVVGVGLMGGSLAWALRNAGFVSEIIGLDKNPDALATAIARGLIDRGLSSLEPGDADIVVLATPVGTLPGLLTELQPLLSAAQVVTDMGSVKQPIAEAARGMGLRRFVPGHPMAGAECSGPEAARADLFKGRAVVLTPFEGSDPEAVTLVRSLWEAVGARVVIAEASWHDGLVAYTSHLPHLLAFACADLLGEQGAGFYPPAFIGTGLQDFLRIAGSDPVMWRDICVANAEPLGAALSAYSERLADYRAALAKGDFEGLRVRFSEAQAFRKSVSEGIEHGNA